jgi:hypothetical protein
MTAFLVLLRPCAYDSRLSPARTLGIAVGARGALRAALRDGKARALTEKTSPAERGFGEAKYEDSYPDVCAYHNEGLDKAVVELTPAYVEELKASVFPAEEVTLDVPESENAAEWYNLPPTDPADTLPRLSAWSYITVVRPFAEVRLSAAAKGAPLTVQDLLCACRGLMPFPTRNSVRSCAVTQRSFAQLTLRLFFDKERAEWPL